MLGLFRRILWDESAFERYGRMMLMGGAMMVATGQIPLPPRYAWIPAALSVLIGAGEKNKPQSAPAKQ